MSLKEYKILSILEKNWLKDYNALKGALSEYSQEQVEKSLDELHQEIKHFKKHDW